MAEVNLNINGRSFGIACDDGQEDRVVSLGHYVDARLKDISQAGAASNESHLLVLTSIVLADEIADLREDLQNYANGNGAAVVQDRQEERQLCNSIDHLAARIESIAGNIEKL